MLLSLSLILAQAAEAAKDVDGGWAAYLQTYGGWATTVVLAGVVAYLWRYTTKIMEQKPPSPEQLREAREAQALKDKVSYEQLHKELFDELHDKLVPLIAAIDNSTKASNELKTEAQELFRVALKERDATITKLAQQKDQVGSEAMAKMEELYGQMLGLMERVIGAAKSLAQVEERLRGEGGGDKSGATT
jgi:hypothetical protein